MMILDLIRYYNSQRKAVIRMISYKKVQANVYLDVTIKETKEQKTSRELIQTISKLPHKEAKSKKDIEEWLNED